MLIQVFAVMDKKAGVFKTPFFLVHEADAVRGFQKAVMDEKSYLNDHPDEYDLYSLGMFDDINGKFVSKEIRFIVNGQSFKKVEVKNE